MFQGSQKPPLEERKRASPATFWKADERSKSSWLRRSRFYGSKGCGLRSRWLSKNRRLISTGGLMEHSWGLEDFGSGRGGGGGRETRGLCYRRPPELTFPPRVLTPPATAAPPSPRRLGERNARPNPLPAQCRSPLPPSARLTGAHPGTITRGITPNRLLCRGARCVNAALLQRLHGSGS